MMTRFKKKKAIVILRYNNNNNNNILYFNVEQFVIHDIKIQRIFGRITIINQKEKKRKKCLTTTINNNKYIDVHSMTEKKNGCELYRIKSTKIDVFIIFQTVMFSYNIYTHSSQNSNNNIKQANKQREKKRSMCPQ